MLNNINVDLVEFNKENKKALDKAKCNKLSREKNLRARLNTLADTQDARGVVHMPTLALVKRSLGSSSMFLMFIGEGERQPS